MANPSSKSTPTKTESSTAADAATNAQQAFETSTDNFVKVVDGASKHSQEMGEKALVAMKQASLSSLDVYQKSLDDFLSLQKKFVGASGNDRVDEAFAVQMKLITDVSNAATSAMRKVLK